MFIDQENQHFHKQILSESQLGNCREKDKEMWGQGRTPVSCFWSSRGSAPEKFLSSKYTKPFSDEIVFKGKTKNCPKSTQVTSGTYFSF